MESLLTCGSHKIKKVDCILTRSQAKEIWNILDKNIVCADALTYHYRFDVTPPTMTESELISREFFSFK